MLVDLIHGYRLGTFDNKSPHLGFLQGMKDEDVPSSILRMGLEKKNVPHPYHRIASSSLSRSGILLTQHMKIDSVLSTTKVLGFFLLQKKHKWK
jgi:hypothetical protein